MVQSSRVRNVRPVLRIGLLAGLLLGAAAACEQALTPADGVARAERVEGTGSIAGRIVNAEDLPIAGAAISTPGGATTVSDGNGDFVLGGLPATNRLAVTVSAAGYASNTAIFPVVAGATLSRVLQLAARGPSVRIDAAAGGVVSFADGGRITIPPFAFAGVGRGQFVDVSVTYFDPGAGGGVASVRLASDGIMNTGDGLAGAPGDFSAVEADGTDSQLETAGMVDVEVTDPNGAPVSVAPGQTVTINFPDRDGAASRGWGLYEFNAATGNWERRGNAPASPDGTPEVTVPSLDRPWNADIPMTATCISVQVNDSNGQPRANEEVKADGVNWRGPTTEFTDGNGVARLQVQASAQVTVSAGPNLDSQTVTAPAVGANCPLTATLAY